MGGYGGQVDILLLTCRTINIQFCIDCFPCVVACTGSAGICYINWLGNVFKLICQVGGEKWREMKAFQMTRMSRCEDGGSPCALDGIVD